VNLAPVFYFPFVKSGRTCQIWRGNKKQSMIMEMNNYCYSFHASSFLYIDFTKRIKNTIKRNIYNPTYLTN